MAVNLGGERFMPLGRLAIGVLVVILILWAASPLLVIWLFPTKDWAIRGQFADSYGAVNALFSGLALAGVVLAIFMQREELQLQREELTATREELRRSAEAQTASSQALTIQVQVMQLTARLDALASLLDFYERHRGGQFPNNLGYQRPASELAQETMHRYEIS